MCCHLIMPTNKKNFKLVLLLLVGFFLLPSMTAEAKSTTWNGTIPSLNWALGYNNWRMYVDGGPIVVKYEVEIRKKTTGDLINVGESVVVGTDLILKFLPQSQTTTLENISNITWGPLMAGVISPPMVYGAVFGTWIANAVSPPSNFTNSNRYRLYNFSDNVNIGYITVYTPVVISPPAKTIANLTGMSCGALTGDNENGYSMECKITNLGQISPSFDFSSTYGKIYARHYRDWNNQSYENGTIYNINNIPAQSIQYNFAATTVYIPTVVVSHSTSTTFNLTVTESAKPAPTNVVVTQEVCNGTGAFHASLKISWDKIPNATSYKLYRAPTTPAAETSPVTVNQPTSGTKVEFLDKGLVSASSLGYGYEVLAVYGNPPLEQESKRTMSDPAANPTKDCSLPSNESSVSLSCGSTSECIANYNGSVSLSPIGQGWNSCTTASTPEHIGWNSASWLVSSPAFNPTTGLVAYYKFDETSGTIASDSYGSNNGTLINNPTWATAGKFSGALSFDGINNYVDTKDFSFSKNDSFTFSVWAKTLAFGASQVMFGKPVSGWEYSLMTYGTNSVRFAYWNTSGNAEIDLYSPSNSFPNNTWTHFVISYDSSAPTKIAKMYVNGVEKTSDN